jgi:hypothetical protein
MLGQENETGYLIMSTINWWRKAVFWLWDLEINWCFLDSIWIEWLEEDSWDFGDDFEIYEGNCLCFHDRWRRIEKTRTIDCGWTRYWWNEAEEIEEIWEVKREFRRMMIAGRIWHLGTAEWDKIDCVEHNHFWQNIRISSELWIVDCELWDVFPMRINFNCGLWVWVSHEAVASFTNQIDFIRNFFQKRIDWISCDWKYVELGTNWSESIPPTMWRLTLISLLQTVPF